MTEQLEDPEELDSAHFNLVRILEDQIVDNWDLIRGSILLSFREATEEMLANVMTSLLERQMEAWVLYYQEGTTNTVFGVITTRISEDKLAGVRALYVYSLSAIRPTPLKAWARGLLLFRKIAQSRGCNRILARTTNDRFVELLNKLGANTSVRLVEMEV